MAACSRVRKLVPQFVDLTQLHRPDNVGVKLLGHGHQEELAVAQLLEVVLFVGGEQRLLMTGQGKIGMYRGDEVARNETTALMRQLEEGIFHRYINNG